jgi:hypothetical protein
VATYIETEIKGVVLDVLTKREDYLFGTFLLNGLRDISAISTSDIYKHFLMPFTCLVLLCVDVQHLRKHTSRLTCQIQVRHANDSYYAKKYNIDGLFSGFFWLMLVSKHFS